jgi:hypothetical protein
MEYSMIPKENTVWSKNGIEGGSQREHSVLQKETATHVSQLE